MPVVTQAKDFSLDILSLLVEYAYNIIIAITVIVVSG